MLKFNVIVLATLCSTSMTVFGMDDASDSNVKQHVEMTQKSQAAVAEFDSLTTPHAGNQHDWAKILNLPEGTTLNNLPAMEKEMLLGNVKQHVEMTQKSQAAVAEFDSLTTPHAGNQHDWAKILNLPEGTTPNNLPAMQKEMLLGNVKQHVEMTQ